MKTIKFSHDYAKIRALDDISFTRLQQVFICNRNELGELFVRYDTAHASGFYNLPKGKLIVLLLQSRGQLWTTIRRWTPWKEKYYRGLMGQEVKIKINN